jgi:hypothetical protein
MLDPDLDPHLSFKKKLQNAFGLVCGWQTNYQFAVPGFETWRHLKYISHRGSHRHEIKELQEKQSFLPFPKAQCPPPPPNPPPSFKDDTKKWIPQY